MQKPLYRRGCARETVLHSANLNFLGLDTLLKNFSMSNSSWMRKGKWKIMLSDIDVISWSLYYDNHLVLYCTNRVQLINVGLSTSDFKEVVARVRKVYPWCRRFTPHAL